MPIANPRIFENTCAAFSARNVSVSLDETIRQAVAPHCKGDPLQEPVK
jgi:hypothetical protein